MKKLILAALLGWSGAASAQMMITHTNLQSVTSTGTTAWVEVLPFKIQGVIVNDPEEMLDYTYNPDATASNLMGGQFQVFFQAVDAGDRGGTALWMAQNYQVMGPGYAGEDYGTEWTNEMRRVQYDTNGRKFRKGDWIEVTARKALFRGGKLNINERHRITLSNDFDVALVKANVGLPQAEAITLADLKNPDDSAIFDATRATGGEHWQGMRVRLDGIRLVNTNGWGKTNWADRICMATDDAGRTFTLRMPLTDLGPVPATTTVFSATGILNQENSNTNGYELFVQEIGPVLDFERRTGGTMAVSFSSDYEGYVLEATDDLESGPWSAVDLTPRKMIVIEDDGAESNRVYRLRKVD